MSSRLNVLPDPAFQDLRTALSDRLERLAVGIQPDQFGSLMDSLMTQTLERGFAEAGAHEGTLWLLDPDNKFLVPAWNSGPNAARLVGQFKQPLNAGLICMVFASEQPFLENEVWNNSQQSKLLDSLLKVKTAAMIAVPFYFLRGCRGVVSCVQLKSAGPEADPAGFRPEHLAHVQRATTLMSKLVELKLLGRTVGWSE